MPTFNTLEEAFACKPGPKSLLPRGFKTRHLHSDASELATATVQWFEVEVITYIDPYSPDTTKCECLFHDPPEGRIILHNGRGLKDAHGPRWVEMNFDERVEFDDFHGRLGPWDHDVHESQIRAHSEHKQAKLPKGQYLGDKELEMKRQEVWLQTRGGAMYRLDRNETTYRIWQPRMLTQWGWKLIHIQRWMHTCESAEGLQISHEIREGRERVVRGIRLLQSLALCEWQDGLVSLLSKQIVSEEKRGVWALNGVFGWKDELSWYRELYRVGKSIAASHMSIELVQ